jgi:predicted TIM-barrel fold metal-dependent hydrolase
VALEERKTMDRKPFVVDVHYHFLPLVPDSALGLLTKDIEYGRQLQGLPTDPETLIRVARETLVDPTGDIVLNRNRDLGIDMTFINHVDVMIPEADAEIVLHINGIAAELARKHPEQIRAFAGVDPRRPEAPEIARVCLEELGMVGIKWHPDYGFDIAGDDARGVLTVLDRSGGVLLTHTGPLPGARYRFATLEGVADVLADFPNLRVIAAHMGKAAWHEWAGLAHDFPNLYGDLAVWSRYGNRNFDFFCRQLRELCWYAGVEKVLWGTDDPFENHTVPTRQFIEMMEALATRAPTGYEFSREEVDLMLGGNAARLFDLNHG